MAISTAGAGATIQATDIRLGRMLQEYGLINDHQLFDALQTQAANGGRLASILVRRGCLSDMELAEVATSRKDTDTSTHNVHLTLAPVPVDCVSLPGAVAMCLSLIVPEGVEWGSGPSASCFATMNLILPDEASNWVVSARGRHAQDRFELLSDDQVALGYDLAVRPVGCSDVFPLAAGGASAIHIDRKKGGRGPVQALVEACVSHDCLKRVPPGQYVEYIDLSVNSPESDFLA
ncbi:MAG: hypothetical protein AAF563_07075 [Pseudomonadota bacterium]